MANENEVSTELLSVEGGKIIFAPDVIATIASLATSDVDGVEGMAGTVVEGIAGMLNKKSLTKGVKVEVGESDVTVDMSIVVRYGYRIHEVCINIQKGVKNAIETMTGLHVKQVNIAVQSISFDKSDPKKEKEKEKEKAESQPEE